MEKYVVIEKIDPDKGVITVLELGKTTKEVFKIEPELLSDLYFLAIDAEEHEEPALVLMNEKNQFVL